LVLRIAASPASPVGLLPLLPELAGILDWEVDLISALLKSCGVRGGGSALLDLAGGSFTVWIVAVGLLVF